MWAGDAYFCASNLVKDQSDHTIRIARFAIDAIRAANETAIEKGMPERGCVNIRVGTAASWRDRRLGLGGGLWLRGGLMDILLRVLLHGGFHCGPVVTNVVGLRNPRYVSLALPWAVVALGA